MTFPSPSPYGWLMLAGICLSAIGWARLARRDDRLLVVYVMALVGAFLGAKLAYFVAEGWRETGQPDFWLRLATGKSILGALFGGYAAVELTKRWVGFQGVTGDWFAPLVAIGVIVGRVGCWWHGCCLGRPGGPGWCMVRDVHGVERWPAVPLEILINVVMLAILVVLRVRHRCTGQHFHLYLVVYGAFRFFHEFLRDTPRIAGPFSGYHFLAAGLVVFGLGAFIHRQKVRAGLD